MLRTSRTEILRIVLPLIVFGAGVGGFILLVVNKPTPAFEPPTQDEPIVETAAVQRHSGEITIKVNGLVVPNREIDVSAQVAGRVIFKSPRCRKGKTVQLQGNDQDIMLRIDPRDYDIAFRRLSNQKKQAIASRAEVEEEIKGTTEVLTYVERMATLQQEDLEDKRASNVLAAADLRREEDELLKAKQAVTTSSMLLSQLNFRQSRLLDEELHLDIQMEKAQLDLDRTLIKSPTSGVIVEDSVEEGEYVPVGTRLFTIEDTSIREIECRLRKQELMWVLLAQDPSLPAAGSQGPTAAAEVIHETAGIQYIWKARLAGYASSGVDPKTRMIPCRVMVDNPEQSTLKTLSGAKRTGAEWPLLRDTYVTVAISIRPRAELFTIPTKAIHPGRTVWLVRDGRLDKAEIQIVQQTEETAVVYAPRGDVDPGDKMVVSPLAFPRVGDSVQEPEAK